jgi:hypothetical protein
MTFRFTGTVRAFFALGLKQPILALALGAIGSLSAAGAVVASVASRDASCGPTLLMLFCVLAAATLALVQRVLPCLDRGACREGEDLSGA